MCGTLAPATPWALAAAQDRFHPLQQGGSSRFRPTTGPSTLTQGSAAAGPSSSKAEPAPTLGPARQPGPSFLPHHQPAGSATVPAPPTGDPAGPLPAPALPTILLKAPFTHRTKSASQDPAEPRVTSLPAWSPRAPRLSPPSSLQTSRTCTQRPLKPPQPPRRVHRGAAHPRTVVRLHTHAHLKGKGRRPEGSTVGWGGAQGGDGVDPLSPGATHLHLFPRTLETCIPSGYAFHLHHEDAAATAKEACRPGSPTCLPGAAARNQGVCPAPRSTRQDTPSAAGRLAARASAPLYASLRRDRAPPLPTPLAGLSVSFFSHDPQ